MERPPTETKVILADREGFGRDAVAALLRSIPGVELVAEPTTAAALRVSLAEQHPEALVVDDRLAGSLIDLPRPAARRVIVLGADDDPGYAARAARLGAETWLAKDRAADVLPALLCPVEGVILDERPFERRAAALGTGR